MFEPNNEMGVVVRFTQIAESVGYEIVSIQSAFPDAVIKDAVKGGEYLVEFEYYASNFIAHRHDVRNCDLIICWVNDLDNDFPLTIWELSTIVLENYSIKMATEEQKEIAYLRAENKYLRRRLVAQEQIDTPTIDGDAGQRVLAYIEQVQQEHGRTPGQSEIARAVGVSKSTADTVLKRYK